MTAAGPLVVIGDALLDRDINGTASRLCPDAPAPVLDELTETRRPGGAALAALLAARDGGQVVLVTPIGDDPSSTIVRALLEPHVTVVPMPLDGPLPDKARFRAGGQTLLRADGPAGRPGQASREAAEAIASAGTLLVSDYGQGVTADERIRAALAGRAARVPLVWDPHPRGAVPVPGTRLATPNHREALAAAGVGPVPAVPPTGGPAPARAGGPAPAPAGGPAPVFRAAVGGRGRRPAARPVDGRRRGRDPGPARYPARPRRTGTADRACPAHSGHGHLRGRGPLAAAAAMALAHGALPSEAVVTATGTATDFLASGGVAASAAAPGLPARACCLTQAYRQTLARPRTRWRWPPGSARVAAPWWPLGGASTCCMPGTSACSGRPARWGTA